ncbi:MAG: transcriptional regulator NrdR [Acidobacteriota bacterium]
MRCPYCQKIEDRVVDSRESREGETIRRRRECLGCGHRFTTYEVVDITPVMVVKKDGRREVFTREKVMAGLQRACEKRPIAPQKIDEIANEIERYVQELPNRECPTRKIGDIIMKSLRQIDKVAYVRFASVYLDFSDIYEFMNEIKGLAKKG